MTEIAILVGGPEMSLPDLHKLDHDRLLWIGVDRGAVRLLELGIKPHIALGDFDSVSKDEFEWIKKEVKDVRRFKAEKDATDTEIAVEAAFTEFVPEKVTIYGATGGRLDHLLNNLWLVFQPKIQPHLAKIQISDRQNNISYYQPGTYKLKKEEDKTYLAFICLTAVEKLTLFDAKYRLKEADFAYPTSLASNEFVSDTTLFSFQTGLIAVIQSKD